MTYSGTEPPPLDTIKRNSDGVPERQIELCHQRALTLLSFMALIVVLMIGMNAKADYSLAYFCVSSVQGLVNSSAPQIKHYSKRCSKVIVCG